MTSNTSPNYYLLKIGGWGGILSGLFFLIVTAYIFGFLTIFGFDFAMFDDPGLLHPWVSEHTKLYQFSWLLYLLTQLFLLPVPLALGTYFASKDDQQMALAQLGQMLGVAAITIAILSPAILYAAAPITARSYVEAAGSIAAQSQVIFVSNLTADIAKYLRLFSEMILGGWLVIMGALFMVTGRSKAIGRLVLSIGVWTLVAITIKIFNPYSPLEDSLGIVFALAYIPLGMHMLRANEASGSVGDINLNSARLSANAT